MVSCPGVPCQPSSPLATLVSFAFPSCVSFVQSHETRRDERIATLVSFAFPSCFVWFYNSTGTFPTEREIESERKRKNEEGGGSRNRRSRPPICNCCRNPFLAGVCCRLVPPTLRNAWPSLRGVPHMGTSPAMRRRIHGYSMWRWRLGFLVVLGIVAFVGVAKFQDVQSPTEESEYITTFPDQIPVTKPKIAFLFLARNQMPVDFLWAHFFNGVEAHEYSVYIHARPGVIYTRKNTECKAFYNRQLANSVSVEWGAASMIEAERLLLSAALEDPLNERFLLLSDSCVPLYTFKYVYDYVMTSPKSFVDSFIDYNDDRYDPRMAPEIKEDRWRKGSQWFVLLRKHAEAVVSDTTIFPIFRQHCKRLALPEYWRANTDNETEEHNCIPDEHYIQTLLAILGLEEDTERRTLTYSRWKDYDAERDRQGWHPVTFNYPDATLQAIKEIQEIIKIHYVTESRTEWCSSNGEPRPCYLFARKFTKGAGIRLFDIVKKYERPPDNRKSNVAIV